MKILDYLRVNLTKVFENLFTQIQIIDEICEIPENSYDSSRDQYLSPLFLYVIRAKAEKLGYDKVLGITTLDLFVYELNFVFGQAEFGSHAKAAVISLFRLYPEFYGQSSNTSLFLMRVVKVGIHELGHTLGLEHCHANCIMKFSNCIGDTDNKPVNFCETCRKKLSFKS